MSVQRYSVAQHSIDTLLSWIKSGQIAIPEIQRPFVWTAVKVRNLLDSLYQGFPVGYLILWQNPKARLKDGSLSSGKQILIDGQQRVTALMAALLGQKVLTSDYETVRIRIAFHPEQRRFEVANPAIDKDASWIGDVASLFGPGAHLMNIVRDYMTANPQTVLSENEAFDTLFRVQQIVYSHVGIISLADDLPIETVTEIFIRVNSAGVALGQADFAMSKIATNTAQGGDLLRKAIDYFCHGVKSLAHLERITQNDTAFVATEFYSRMRWLKNDDDDLYQPSYTDMLRVAFASEFGRGKLQDLVALLSGRNFQTKEYEAAIVEASFAQLKKGVLAFMGETAFKRMRMIVRSAGFITTDLIRAQNNLNFAYVLLLRGKNEAGLSTAALYRLVSRWYAFSVLTRRYSRGNPETEIDYDLRQIEAQELVPYTEAAMAAQLSDNYWDNLLPRELETSSTTSGVFLAYQAAQATANDLGFLSHGVTVPALLLNRVDVHHIYPRNYLKGLGVAQSAYNQIANFVLMQSDINIAIGDKPPEKYFGELRQQVSVGNGAAPRYGSITDEQILRANLTAHALPVALLDGPVPTYENFLKMRRVLMAQKIRQWFEGL